MNTILDCIASDEVALGILQREFDDTWGYHLIIKDIVLHTTYSQQSILNHIKEYKDFYRALGASITSKERYKYILNPKSALIIIANFNKEFRGKVGFVSNEHLTLPVKSQLQVVKLNKSSELIPTTPEVQQAVPDALSELERRFKEEKQQLLHQIKEYIDSNIKLHNQILELQQQIDVNKLSMQFANEKVADITTHIEALLKIQNYHFDTHKSELENHRE